MAVTSKVKVCRNGCESDLSAMFYKHMSVLVVEGQTDTYEHHTNARIVLSVRGSPLFTT